MRWPWRRKPRKSLAAQRIDRAIGRAVADIDEDGIRITGNWGDPELAAQLRAASPERAKPDNQQVSGNYSEIPNSSTPLPGLPGIDLPPCAPFPEHEPHDYPGVCFCCHANTTAVLWHSIPGHDCRNFTIELPQENPMTTPEPAAESREEADRRLADIVRDVRDAALPGYTTQIGGVKIAKCDTRGVTAGERAEYQRGLNARRALPEWEKAVLIGARALAAGEPGCHLIPAYGKAAYSGKQRIIVDTEAGEYERMEAEWKRREAKLTAEPEVGSAAWLRDLADRLHLYLITRFEIPADTAAISVGSPDSIRDHANEIERREHKTAADNRDRERVVQIVLRQWETAARANVDAALAKLGEVVGVDLDNPAPEYDVSGFWATLTDEQQAEALAPALELYRAGRDDQEAEQ